MTGHYGTVAERFWAKVQKTDTCWLWTGSLDKDGYGQLKTSKGHRASRVSWELHYGPIPDGLSVCHHCDIPACVRPDHLFVGSPKQNTHDMIRKHRMARNERHPNTKIGAEHLASIRRRWAAGETQRELAHEFGVGRSHI
jgi:hypothetical protein